MHSQDMLLGPARIAGMQPARPKSPCVDLTSSHDEVEGVRHSICWRTTISYCRRSERFFWMSARAGISEDTMRLCHEVTRDEHVSDPSDRY